MKVSGFCTERAAVVRAGTTAALIAAVATMLFAGCGRAGPGNLRPVVIATADQPVGAALYVARANGYFENEGLAVTFERRTSGRDALAAMVDGQAQFCETAETPIVLAVLRGTPVLTLATISSTKKGMAIIARGDRGIVKPADLVGKRIGVTMNTNAEFFLGVFLLANEIGEGDVELIDLGPEEMVDALAAKRVDAAATWEPHLGRLRKTLGDGGTLFADERLYTWAWNIAGDPTFVAANPEVAEALMRAVVRASRLVVSKPSEAQEIVAAHMGVGVGSLADVWGAYEFEVSLAQWLLLSMEDQARWALNKGLVEASRVPNYLETFYPAALESVDPEAVELIR